MYILIHAMEYMSLLNTTNSMRIYAREQHTIISFFKKGKDSVEGRGGIQPDMYIYICIYTYMNINTHHRFFWGKKKRKEWYGGGGGSPADTLYI